MSVCFHHKGVGEEGETTNNKPFINMKHQDRSSSYFQGNGGALCFNSEHTPCEQAVWVARLKLDGRQ